MTEADIVDINKNSSFLQKAKVNNIVRIWKI
jgi:hypothetical protein